MSISYFTAIPPCFHAGGYGCPDGEADCQLPTSPEAEKPKQCQEACAADAHCTYFAFSQVYLFIGPMTSIWRLYNVD